ncbi:MAG TPA: signal peptidase I [Streptosporangiaceae bacterium]
MNDADPPSSRGTHPYADSEGDTSADRPAAGEPADGAGSSNRVAGGTNAEAAGAVETGGTTNGSGTGAQATDTGDTATGDAGAATATGTRAATRPSRRRRRRTWRSLLVELLSLVAIALLLGAVIKTWALQPFFIPSSSMEKTLEINDRVLVNKLVYDFRGIDRGDIVVFNGQGSWDPGTPPPSATSFPAFLDNLAGMFGLGSPGDVYVKRVIGLPGDHVACCDSQGRVTVNGVPLSEGSYLYPGDVPSMTRFNITVPTNSLWVMGDHRYVSDDSRGHVGDPGGGTVPESAVIGRAFVIIWPASRWRILPIPATFSQSALNKHGASASVSGGAGPAELLGARLEPAAPILPWSLGFAGAVPLALLPRRISRRWVHRHGRETS